jgi:hypothetical protein
VIQRERVVDLTAGDMIGQDALPENLVARCLDVLRILSPNERDLIRVVVEVVHELRDASDPEEDIVVSRFPLPHPQLFADLFAHLPFALS